MTKSDSSKAAPIALLLLPYGEHTIGATYKSLEIKRTIDLASSYDGDREVRSHGKKTVGHENFDVAHQIVTVT